MAERHEAEPAHHRPRRIDESPQQDLDQKMQKIRGVTKGTASKSLIGRIICILRDQSLQAAKANVLGKRMATAAVALAPLPNALELANVAEAPGPTAVALVPVAIAPLRDF
jgi:hypothetical protein